MHTDLLESSVLSDAACTTMKVKREELVITTLESLKCEELTISTSLGHSGSGEFGSSPCKKIRFQIMNFRF